MNGSLDSWASELSQAEAQILLIRAAKEHESQFTNPDEVGVSWAMRLKSSGYGALPPFAREYLARRYLRYHETVGA